MIVTKCNLCGFDDWRVRFPAHGNHRAGPNVDTLRCTSNAYGNHLQIVECRRCGHIYSNPRFDANELIEAYSAVEDETYLFEQAGREKTFAKHLKELEVYTGPGVNKDLLDVGAYTGVFVQVAMENRWRAVGIEPSTWAAKIAQERGLPVLQGTLDSSVLEGRTFDAITMWDVIEHLDDPSADLDKSYHMMKAGGVIAVHTMNINSFVAKIMGRRWPWLMDMHIHYFSQDTLTKFLQKSGFEILWAGSQGRYLSLGYLVTRLYGLSEALGNILNSGVKMMDLKETLVPVNLGDLMTVYARRPKKNDCSR